MKSSLVGRYEMVKLEFVDDTSILRKMLIIRGTMEEMCAFYEEFKDAMESAVNDDLKKFGITDVAGVHHVPCPDEDLDDWRKDPDEIKAYAKVKRNAKREGLLRFVAEETRFSFPGDPRSWMAALESAILSTGISVEPEAVEA